MPSTASLVARGLGKSFGRAVVLDGVDLTVGPDTRAGVVGPNGTGKTTLLRLLAGLERPDRGSIALLPPSATVGYLPQEPERRAGETLRAFLGRRTGVAAADQAMEDAAAALAAPDAPTDADERYAAALDRWMSLGGADFDTRVGVVGDDLGLPAALLDAPMTGLSGGEAARASLAAILLSRFDVFLLDEPTNDLDFDGLARLEQFVNDLTGGVVIVSHDRAFLERTITSVIELDPVRHTAIEFGGGWLAYLDARAVARRHAEEAYATYDAQRSELLARARTQRQWAQQGARTLKKKPVDNDKAQRGFKVNRTEKQAAKVRATERALDRLDAVDKPWEPWELRLSFGDAERSGAIVFRLQDAVVERGDFQLGPVDLEIGWADRVGVLGPNGGGKTTLLNAMLGRLSLTRGERWAGPGVVVGELGQARVRFAARDSLLDAFIAATGLVLAEARSLLAKFDLSAADVERPAATLSPGERTRAELALLMAQGVNCIVLDEPTNHLDLPAIEQLEVALEAFGGTLLLVTHDRQLLEAVELTRTVDVVDGKVSERR
jgi:ATPase subunit of ABC transporter with duplicated ATPase domains